MDQRVVNELALIATIIFNWRERCYIPDEYERNVCETFFITNEGLNEYRVKVDLYCSEMIEKS